MTTRGGMKGARSGTGKRSPMRYSFPTGLLLLLLLPGCLPYSCNRTETRALAPADSLSRQIAAGVVPDTLEALWQTAGPEATPLVFPRTVGFGPGGQLYVTDAEADRLFAFSAEGTLLEVHTWDGLAVPYLAGRRGDTLVVFSPETHRLDFVVDGVPVRTVATPDDLPRGPLQYAAATSRALFFKVDGDDFDGYLARLDEAGRVDERYALPGPPWRHAGLLRAWGDSLLSLAGYRPVIDVLPPGGTRLDTLALAGFDSPMLPRSYAFLRGDTHAPPLLSSAAAPAGDRLFVLNLRAGWLRIDVYDRQGHLQAVLVQEDPQYDRQFFPMDLAVRRAEDGAYEIAVAVPKPRPALHLYRWPGR